MQDFPGYPFNSKASVTCLHSCCFPSFVLGNVLPPCAGECVQIAHAWSYNGKIGRAFNTRRKEHRRNVELCKNSGNIIDKGNYRHRETLESWHTACQKTLTTYNSKHLPEQYRKKLYMEFKTPCNCTGRIWNRTKIRPFQPCKHTRTTEPDEFETT
jgi:hypothetical protein